MAHCEKYTKADVIGMFIHYERTPGHSLSNKDIDTERSHLNYNAAADDQPLSQRKFLAIRLKQIRTNNRKNQNVVCDWVVTQPRDVKDEDSRTFFRAVYEFISERYGKENVVSAYVHMDEIGQTPHMHFCFMPVEKMEDGTEKLNAKTVIDRNELRNFHPALQKAVDKALGYHVSIQTGVNREQGGNKTVKQLKEETALKEQLPKGKKKVLSSDLSYTAEENAELHALAEDGISYRIEKKALQERQKLQEMKERLYSGRLEEVKQQRADLSELIDQTEKAAAIFGAPDAKTYITISQENIQLHNKVDLLEDSILTIAENVGSDIMQEIPLKSIDVDISTIPARPSRKIMRVIWKYVDEAMAGIRERMEALTGTLREVINKLIDLSGKNGTKEIESIRMTADDALFDLSAKRLLSADKLVPDESKQSQKRTQRR